MAEVANRITSFVQLVVSARSRPLFAGWPTAGVHVLQHAAPQPLFCRRRRRGKSCDQFLGARGRPRARLKIAHRHGDATVVAQGHGIAQVHLVAAGLRHEATA